MILRRSLVFLLMLSASIGWGRETDSLKKALAETPAVSKRASISIRLGKAYLAEGKREHVAAIFDSAILYARNGAQLAKQDRNDKLVMDAFVVVGEAINEKCQPERAIAYYDSALRYAVMLRDEEMRSTCLGHKAQLLAIIDQYALAIDAYKEAIEIDGRRKNMIGVTEKYIKVASAYRGLGEISISFAVLQQAMHLCDSLHDADLLTDCYIEAGRIFNYERKNKLAYRYFKMADSIAVSRGDSGAMIRVRYSIANYHKLSGDNEKAIALCQEALKYCIRRGKVRGQMTAHQDLGDIYTEQGKYALATEHYTTGLRLNDSVMHLPLYSMESYFSLGRLYRRNKQYDKALHYVELAGKVAVEHELPLTKLRRVNQLLSAIYADKGDYKEAYEYNKIYAKIQDSLFYKWRHHRFAEVETRFKISEKNIELSMLAKENELNKVKSQRLAIIVGLGGLLVLVGAGGYRRSIRQNARLTEQKKTIDDQLSQLAAASEMKSKFYANASHELRTPVTLLTGMLRLVQDETGTTKNNKKLEVAYNNSLKLQQLVEEVLSLSRMGKTEAVLKQHPVALAPLLSRIVYAFESFIDKKGLQLVFDDSEVKDTYVAIDEGAFEKVINNLVYNAIKFNKEGGAITVRAFIEANKQVRIEVSDTGQGISTKDLPHIFERFYQGTSTNQAEGVGVGLSLVKELTHVMGGGIEVSSIIGKGSTFLLRFPIVEAIAAEPETVEAALPSPEKWENFSNRQTVLIVEDNTEMRYYLKEVLGVKVNIAEAGNGKEALAWLENNTPDLIISDVMMPEMDGETLVKHLKGNDGYKKIPLMILTALSDVEDRLNMLRLGVDDHMIKPFNGDELRIRVYNLLNNSAERKDIHATAAQPDEIPEDTIEADEFRRRITVYVSAQLKNTNVSVNDLAYELALSQRQLYRLAKEYTGCTPAQLIKEVKLQKAYELVHTGTVYKVEDLSKRVGFEKASYFSQLFYERFGKRPSEFL